MLISIKFDNSNISLKMVPTFAVFEFAGLSQSHQKSANFIAFYLLSAVIFQQGKRQKVRKRPCLPENNSKFPKNYEYHVQQVILVKAVFLHSFKRQVRHQRFFAVLTIFSQPSLCSTSNMIGCATICKESR